MGALYPCVHTVPRRLPHDRPVDPGDGVKKQAGMLMICRRKHEVSRGAVRRASRRPRVADHHSGATLQCDGAQTGLSNKASGMRAGYMNTGWLVRRSARWVLAVWVLAWAGAVMNTCCNLLAEVTDHHDADASQAQAAHQHDTASPHARGVQLPSGACGSHTAPDTYVSASDGLLNAPRASQPGAWVGVVVFLLAASGITAVATPHVSWPATVRFFPPFTHLAAADLGRSLSVRRGTRAADVCRCARI